jgi:hypothetical protein
MRKSSRAIRLAILLALTTCAFGVAVSSAFAAVSIEPFNTAFTGKSPSTTWELGPKGGGWSCGKTSLSGTTNSGKTNYVNATPAFTECVVAIGTAKYPITYSNSCKEKGTIPWTVTFNESGTGSVKANCALKASMFEGACVFTAPEQTLSTGVGWANSGANIELKLNSRFTAVKASAGCKTAGLEGTELGIKTVLTLEGLHAS